LEETLVFDNGQVRLALALRRRTIEPGLFAAIVIVWGGLALFTIYPALRVLFYPGTADYRAIFSDPRYGRSLLHSLAMMGLSTASATLLGLLFAVATTRSDLPLRRFFSFVSFLPLFSPPFIVAFGYIMLFGKNGLVTHGLFGLRASILGWRGLWLAQTLSFFPVATVAIRNVIATIPSSLSRAARNLGASRLNTFATITLPLASGGIFSAALLVAILVLADFGNPILIAGDYSVLATEAWQRVQGWADVGGASVLSLVVMLPSLLLFIAQRSWAKDRGFTTVGGKASSMESESTSRPAKLFFVLACSIVSLLILMIYLALAAGSLVEGWGFDWRPTLRWFAELGPRWADLGRSLCYSAAAAAGSALFGIVAAYLVHSKRMPLRAAADLAAMLPAALPGIFIGIGYSIAFNRPPLDLYGTPLIVILALGTWNLSTSYQTGIESLKQIAPSLGEAAANLGARPLLVFRQIYLPLLRGPFASATVVGFIRSITTLSVIVFISTSSNSVATFSIMNFVNDGMYGKASALSVSLLVLAFAAVGLGGFAFDRGVRSTQ
jgi:iron(III) transport system permease protein